jgi:hypothetical protein
MSDAHRRWIVGLGADPTAGQALLAVPWPALAREQGSNGSTHGGGGAVPVGPGHDGAVGGGQESGAPGLWAAGSSSGSL